MSGYVNILTDRLNILTERLIIREIEYAPTHREQDQAHEANELSVNGGEQWELSGCYSGQFQLAFTFGLLGDGGARQASQKSEV